MFMSDEVKVKIPLKKHNFPGQLIVVCGADGAGKTTAINLFEKALIEIGNESSNISRLRQPSDWWRSDLHVHSTLMKKGSAEIFDEFALGVFGVADRYNQQALCIAPALSAGHIVLMDRYVFCLHAYFIARNEPLLNYLKAICEPLFQPDITFVLDCTPQVAIERVMDRDGPEENSAHQQIGPTSDFIEAYRLLARSNELNLISSLGCPDSILNEMLEVYSEHSF